MSSLVTLNNQLHKDLYVDAQEAELQGRSLNMVPVVLSEFLKLAIHFPIVFTKHKETGCFSCVALFGFQPGENLFIKKNQWDSLYVPLQIKRQPFFLGSASGTQDEFFICIDAAHKSVCKKNGAAVVNGKAISNDDVIFERNAISKPEAIFDVNGKDTAYMESIKSILAELANGEPATQAFIKILSDFKLLQAMHLEITFSNGESARIEGLYTINEDNLKNLDSTQIADLHQQGYLHPLYTTITSLGHIYGLIDKKNKLIEGTQ